MEQIETDGSQNLNVSRGTRIHLCPEHTPGSAQRWTLRECGAGLIVERDRPGDPAQDPDSKSQTTRQVASLRAISAGFWQVEMQLSRAWESQGAEIRRFTVTVY